MRNSHCQNMTDVCNATVYAQNPFHLLGLSPFANSKAIRRRKEDLDSADAMGTSGWGDEFKHLLGNTPVPSPDMVAAAFRRIEDPQQRIVDEFFWFWPLDDRDDEALEALQEGRKPTAEKIWKREEKSGDIRRSVIAKHNLAIYNHFYAIDCEWQFIESGIGKDDDAVAYTAMLGFWKDALSRWEDLADDEDFWDVVKERVPVIGDGRLTTGFIRRMRDEFPVAFDRINGDLAVEYAKLPDKHAETERHLRYMNESHQGLDDVQATLDAIFDPVQREVDLLTRESSRVRNATPHSALSAARTLLQNTEGVRRMADEMLGRDHPIRIKIFDKIAAECNFCQVAFGNKTKQWEDCVNFLKEVIPLACDEELLGVMKNNLKIVTQNFEDYKRENYCWFCHEHPADPSLAIKIKMYGDVQIQTQVFSSQYRATWRNITVAIPRCKCCEDAKRKRESEADAAWRAYQASKERRSGWNKFWDVETDETKGYKSKYDDLHERNYKQDKKDEDHGHDFPFYKELKKLGFKEGDKPSEWECQKKYDEVQRKLREDPFGALGLGGGYGRSRYGY